MVPDISKERCVPCSRISQAKKAKAVRPCQMSGTIHPEMDYHISEDLNPYLLSYVMTFVQFCGFYVPNNVGRLVRILNRK